MNEEDIRSSQRRIALGVLVVAVCVAGGFAIGRATVAKPEAPAPAEEQAAPDVEKVYPTISNRNSVIALGQRAAAAVVTGEGPELMPGWLPGRRFEMVLPFGCNGPVPASSGLPMRWSYDIERETLRVHIEPVVWETSTWGLATATDEAETLEQAAEDNRLLRGFWVRWPWSGRDVCPRPKDEVWIGDGPSLIESAETLAIAEVIRRDRSERLRPYEITMRMPSARLDASDGFRIRLKGRFAGIAGSVPVQCVQRGGIDQRPACVVGAVIGEIRLENPASGETLAIWPTLRAGEG